LQAGQGIPGAPQWQARGCSGELQSDGRSSWRSQTQNVSSQRAHFGDIAIASAQGSAALAEEKQPVWIFRAAGLISGSSCVEVVQPRRHLEKVAPLAKVLNAKPEVFDPMDV